MKRLSNIYELINESKKVDNVQLLYLSTITKSTFFKMLQAKCKEFGITFLYADPETSTIEKKDNNNFVLISDSNTYNISVKNTIVLPRLTILKNSNTKNFLKDMENYGFFVLNNLESYENCENKYTTYKVLTAHGISTPKTTVVTCDDMCRLEKKVNVIGGEFPVVCKLLDGKKGIGVFIIDSYMSLKSTLETVFKLVPTAEILLQKKIESDYDLRIHVFNNSYNRVSNNTESYEIIGVMRRNKIDGDFRTNFSLGGTIEAFELTEEQKTLAVRTAAAVKCRWCGVDMIIDKTTGENYIIEVNASPGVKGITSVSKTPPVDYIFNFLQQFKYINTTSTIIGYEESATLLLSGNNYNTPVKFDINNELSIIASPSILYKEKDKKIAVTLGNMVTELPIIGTFIDNTGKVVYMVNCDVEFNDVKYRNVLFNVCQVEANADQFITMGNSFLVRLGSRVAVDPNNSYLVTDIL